MSVAYWVAFNLTPGIGPMRQRALLEHFGSLERAWTASVEELRRAGLDRRSIENLVQTRRTISLEREMDRIARSGAQVVTWEDPDYPANLRQIADAPPLLYVLGTLVPQDEWAVAIVGTRRATVYGREVTRRLAYSLARSGVTIVSGLARGIDATAHQAALDAGGRTIAVLGCGIDLVYPAEHRRLAERIREQGALVSEYPLGTKPEARNFPPRNRIISGLSLGVVIAEAGARSGALITADYAAEQGRDVFAVPGNILNASSVGCNQLIRDGARPVLGVEDILEELNLRLAVEQAEARTVLPSDPTEARLMELLSEEPRHVDELGLESGLPIAVVTSTLALMELKGMVRQVGGMHYVLAREGPPPYGIG
ncbi:MAG: DNA-protecting protein DprA [Anaerolineae bacterium]|nr:DNA-protecting protein DprA [Anaerolineae bacterium]